MPGSIDPSTLPRRRVAAPPARRLAPENVAPVAPLTPRRVDLAPRRVSAVHTEESAPAAKVAVDGIKRDGWFAYVVRRDEFGHLRLAPAWPLWALFVAFPVWWALGVGYFVFPISAIPMGVALLRRRPIRWPPAFWLWAMFLLWCGMSIVMIDRSPPGTHPGSTGGRAVAIVLLLLQYLSATVTLLFVSNLRKDELPQLRLARWMGVLFVVTVAGGVLGTVAPHFEFTSPLELVLPHSVDANPYVTALVHPRSAQLQSVLGEQAGRAAAPFGYTNTWANNLSLLAIWYIVGAHVQAARWRRVTCWIVVTIALFPAIYSLNRGLWIGIAITGVWYAARLFLHGKVAPLLGLFALLIVGTSVFLLSPLASVYQARLEHPESNAVRSFLTSQAVSGAERSPLLGWGGPRRTIGSSQSIAVGASPECPSCGNFSIGSNGQFWAIIFSQGFVGAVFFLGFFGMCIWTYRRDRSAFSQGGVIVVMLTFVYMLFYNSVPVALTITMISIGMLARGSQPSDVPRAEPDVPARQLQPA
jgi:hypothetical protein